MQSTLTITVGDSSFTEILILQFCRNPRFLWISSESEGIRLVISTVKYLLKNKKGMEILGLIVQRVGFDINRVDMRAAEWLVLPTMNKIY